jgi:hypothetical protein
MNFYLSSVDELLRHKQDGPSIGLILCKEKNRIVVEYALRDTQKPMGVAHYKLTEALPDRLKSELPTNEDLASELPVMNLLSLRKRLERALAQIIKGQRTQLEPQDLGVLISKLANQKFLSPKLLKDVQTVARLLNAVIHDKTISRKNAEEVLRRGEVVLSHLESNESV